MTLVSFPLDRGLVLAINPEDVSSVRDLVTGFGCPPAGCVVTMKNGTAHALRDSFASDVIRLLHRGHV